MRFPLKFPFTVTLYPIVSQYVYDNSSSVEIHFCISKAFWYSNHKTYAWAYKGANQDICTFDMSIVAQPQCACKELLAERDSIKRRHPPELAAKAGNPRQEMVTKHTLIHAERVETYLSTHFHVYCCYFSQSYPCSKILVGTANTRTTGCIRGGNLIKAAAKGDTSVCVSNTQFEMRWCSDVSYVCEGKGDHILISEYVHATTTRSEPHKRTNTLGRRSDALYNTPELQNICLPHTHGRWRVGCGAYPG